MLFDSPGTYDIVLLELGVLHYFLDLTPLLSVVHQLLRPGGLLLLREFHPVSTKLITSKGKKHKVTDSPSHSTSLFPHPVMLWTALPLIPLPCVTKDELPVA
jgi:SAM-dependent methyltransferase